MSGYLLGGIYFMQYPRQQLTRIIRTNIFCSANLLAMQARIPCPNGKTKYGLTFELNPLSTPLSHRSGINCSGLTKLLCKRHATKF